MLTIADAIEQGSRRQPQLAARLRRAGRILRFHPPEKVHPPKDDLWYVPSQQRDRVRYLVDRRDHSCSCPDYRQYLATDGRKGAPSGWCKHRLAVGMLLHVQRSNGDSGPQDPPAARTPSVANAHGQVTPQMADVIKACARAGFPIVA